MKVRPATDPACHCLPPPRLPTLVTSPPCSPCGWPSPSSHARSSPRPRPCPHRAAPLACNPCPCPLRHPRRGLVSAPARALPVCLVVFRSSPSRCVSAILKPRRPPSPTPSGPTPSPAATRPLLSRRHSPFPRPAGAVARARRPPSPIGLLGLLSDPSTPPPRGFLAYCTAWLYYILCA